jgi:hypothetical protein
MAKIGHNVTQMVVQSKCKKVFLDLPKEEALAIKYKRTPIDEERALHEAYQVKALPSHSRLPGVYSMNQFWP